MGCALIGQVEVGQTGGNGNDLLDLAFQDQREEEVEEVDTTVLPTTLVYDSCDKTASTSSTLSLLLNTSR